MTKPIRKVPMALYDAKFFLGTCKMVIIHEPGTFKEEFYWHLDGQIHARGVRFGFDEYTIGVGEREITRTTIFKELEAEILYELWRPLAAKVPKTPTLAKK